MTRRRFLTIAAAASMAPPAYADSLHAWQGIALGSEVRITLAGATAQQARKIFHKVKSKLMRIETQFSLHSTSSLSRLNRDGHLPYPARDMLDLFDLAGKVHKATGGLFDPSVQPLWMAVATGGDISAARALVGWDGVKVTAKEIRLKRPGMALTFNGIAQGAAADRIAALMRAQGFDNVMIDMGEVMALGQRPGGGGWQAEIETPQGSPVTRRTLQNRALATSAPTGTRIGLSGQDAHIINPTGQAPLWQLASVEADQAALADALSTAFCLMDRKAIDTALETFPNITVAALI
ncbi:MAG: FAD:protein FMN transferase [Amylibacter sp.]|nr:FAD:protein FMN transferase [Amylibacter sp.]